MEKRLYGKPLMSLEQFTPSEYVSACWYVKSGDCYTNLYHDTKITDFTFYQDSYGYYDQGENVYSSTSRTTSHSSHGNLTPPNAEYFKTDDYPNNINDGKFYTGTDFIAHRWEYAYTGLVDGDVYSYNVDGTTHYFKKYTPYGKHS